MKPDWATRLQRTFARKYDAGFAKGLMLGKAVGARDEQERIIALLKKRWVASMHESSAVTAMRIPVDRKSAMLVIEALIWAIEQGKD